MTTASAMGGQPMGGWLVALFLTDDAGYASTRMPANRRFGAAGMQDRLGIAAGLRDGLENELASCR